MRVRTLENVYVHGCVHMHGHLPSKVPHSSPAYPQGSVQFALKEDEVPCDPGSPNMSTRTVWSGLLAVGSSYTWVTVSG